MAQDKRARAVNRTFGPGNQDLIKGVPKKARQLNKILEFFDKEIDKHTDLTVPPGVSPARYLPVLKCYQTMLRENTGKKEIECKHCQEKFEIDYPKPQLEKNSIEAMKIMMDRIYAKKQSVSHEMSYNDTLINASSKLAEIIVKYCDPGKKQACLAEVTAFLETMKAAQDG